MIKTYLQELSRRGRHPSTLKLSAFWLERARKFFEPRALLELTAGDLQDWRRALSWTPGPSGKLYAENSINQAVGVMRGFYRWALAEGFIAGDPSVELKTSRFAGKPWSRPSVEEGLRLLSALRGEEAATLRDRAIFALWLETGLPLSACVGLELGNLRTDLGALKAKGRRAGVYSLSLSLVAELERYLEKARPVLARQAAEGERALFLSSKGTPMSHALIKDHLRRYQRRL